MTQGLLLSRSTKLNLSKTAAKNPTLLNLQNYKNSYNLYNKTLSAVKKLYFDQELVKHQSNMKKNLGDP
jgi:hypothetical protein